jgi:hypothetical protein
LLEGEHRQVVFPCRRIAFSKFRFHIRDEIVGGFAGRQSLATILQCPHCGTGVKLASGASYVTCPKCAHSVNRDIDEDDAPQDDSAEIQLPLWISPWGVIAFCLATLAIFSASLFGSRILSVSLAMLGLATVGAGLAVTMENRLPRDRAWFVISGSANLTVLCLIVFAGGLLNRLWEMDAAVSKPDPDLLVAMTMNQENRTTRTLKPEDWANAAGEAILQGDVFFRIMAVEAGPLVKGGQPSYLLVQFRIAGRGNEQPIVFEGFRKDKHPPLLKDVMGRSYAFLEQRKRKLPAGGLVFLSDASARAEIRSAKFLDYELVFELPHGDLPPLQLELPASAWGRSGVCKFHVNGLFEPIVPVPEAK